MAQARFLFLIQAFMYCRIGGVEEERGLCPCPNQKRRYWRKHTPGENIIAHFMDKPIGAADTIKGELDGVPFYIFGMKESDYVMQIMSSMGRLQQWVKRNIVMSWCRAQNK